MVKNTRKHLEFFKVFLPEFSSHQLVIPPTFIDIIQKPLPKEALLLDEIGRIWNVETITQDTEERFRVLFHKGWDMFVNDHSLAFGDFLVFRYDGDSRFFVTIFAKDGCRKDLAVVGGDHRDTYASRAFVEKEPVIGKPVANFNEPERGGDCGVEVNRERRFILVNDPGVVGNDGPEKVSGVRTEPGHRVDNAPRKVNRTRDSCDVSWVPEKKRKRCKEPVSIKPENPHFVRNITQDPNRRLEIPSTFLKSNGIDMEEDIELCDENGNKWPMKIVYEEHRGHSFSHDKWSCFAERHNLRKPNKCVFEFVVGSNGRCKEVLVRIFRGSLHTCASKTGYQVVAM